MTQGIEIDEKRPAAPNFKTYLSSRSLILLKPSPLGRKSRIGKIAVLHPGHSTPCSFTGPRPEGPCRSHSAHRWSPVGCPRGARADAPLSGSPALSPAPLHRGPCAARWPLILPIPWAHGLGPRPLFVPSAPAPPCWPPLPSLPALWGPRAVFGPLSFEDQPWPWGRLSQPPASQAQLPPRFLCWIWNYPEASFQLVLCSWARPVTEQPSTKGKLPGDGLKSGSSALRSVPPEPTVQAPHDGEKTPGRPHGARSGETGTDAWREGRCPGQFNL